MATTNEKEKKRLRQYLNPTFHGKNVDIMLDVLASGASHLIDTVEAVNDNLYIATASGQYLDQLFAGRNLTRPDVVGLSDDIFKKLGIEVVNKKQIRTLIHNILTTIYGEDFTQATSISNEYEPYQLEVGDVLILQFDDTESVEIEFKAEDFQNINQAKAQEVADAITKELRRLGRSGAASPKENDIGWRVELFSNTEGPSSTIRVLGGRAQTVLRFDEVRPTSGLATTQWTISIIDGGKVRATWTGGPNPYIGRVRVGDYTTIYGTSFNENNNGTFTITAVRGGLINEAYVEYENPIAVNETVTQGTDDAILFFYPIKKTLNSKTNFAAAFQTDYRLLEVFLPATTRVIRRDRIGAAHIYEGGPANDDDFGPYIWNTKQGFVISETECLTTQVVNDTTKLIINTDNSLDFPDEKGFLIFGYGTSKQEGPVPYIARPSGNTLLINPTYNFKFTHGIGTNVSLVENNYAYDPEIDGTDHQAFLTDVVSGRIYAEELIRLVAALGIRLVIYILYPGDEGLGKWGTNDSEKVFVWGPDPV